MAKELADKKVAFLVANGGIEQVELTAPWEAAKKAGAETHLIAEARQGAGVQSP